MNGERYFGFEPDRLGSVSHLLRQHAQDVAVLAHDRFGGFHLRFEAGIGGGEADAVGLPAQGCTPDYAQPGPESKMVSPA